MRETRDILEALPAGRIWPQPLQKSDLIPSARSLRQRSRWHGAQSRDVRLDTASLVRDGVERSPQMGWLHTQHRHDDLLPGISSQQLKAHGACTANMRLL